MSKRARQLRRIQLRQALRLQPLLDNVWGSLIAIEAALRAAA